MHHHHDRAADGPSDADLAALAAEEPVIAAEVALVDAEIGLISLGRRHATDLDWQRVRAAERAVLAAWLVYLAAGRPIHPRTRRAA